MYMYVCTCRNDIIQWVCRAPPWRQVLGDICHVNVVPCDAVLMCVTASTEGYYMNKVGEDRKEQVHLRGKGRRRGKGGCRMERRRGRRDVHVHVGRRGKKGYRMKRGEEGRMSGEKGVRRRDMNGGQQGLERP